MVRYTKISDFNSVSNIDIAAMKIDLDNYERLQYQKYLREKKIVIKLVVWLLLIDNLDIKEIMYKV